MSDEPEFDALFEEAQEVEDALLSIINRLRPGLAEMVGFNVATSLMMQAHLSGWGEAELLDHLREMLKVAREA